MSMLLWRGLLCFGFTSWTGVQYLYWTGSSFAWILKKPQESWNKSLTSPESGSGRCQRSCNSFSSRCKPEAASGKGKWELRVLCWLRVSVSVCSPTQLFPLCGLCTYLSICYKWGIIPSQLLSLDYIPWGYGVTDWFLVTGWRTFSSLAPLLGVQGGSSGILAEKCLWIWRSWQS